MGFWDWFWGRQQAERALAAPIVIAPPRTPPTLPSAESARVPEPKPEPPPEPTPLSLSVDRAIELMRALPLDEDPELVLRVVRKTLQSSGISVEEIIRHAKLRERELGATAEDLEREIAARRVTLQELGKQIDDARIVWEHLQEALAIESKVGSKPAPSAPVSNAPPPPPQRVVPKASVPPRPRPAVPSVPPLKAVSRAPAPAAEETPVPSFADAGELEPTRPGQVVDEDWPTTPS